MITQDARYLQQENELVTDCDRLVQGSDAWLAFRKRHIGASECPIIMGSSPYVTPYQLWCRKLGFMADQEKTPAMQRGHDLEPIALAAFEKEMGIFMRPTVRVSSAVPFMMASLDGLCLDDQIAVEIKCPNKETHQMALDGVVPEKYIYQLQHQLLVLNLDFMYYFSFDGQNGKSLKVYRDQTLQDRLLEKETEFWSSILNFEPPELSERDYIQKTDADWTNLANKWKRVRDDIKALEQEEESYRNAIIHMANKQNAEGAGIRVQTVHRKGLVDYTKIPELQGVNLNEYRKPATKVVRITECKL